MVLGFVFGYKRKTYKLRKKYDRIREKADKLKKGRKRSAVLKTLDQVSNTLVMLEEQDVSRLEQRRMVKYVSRGVDRAKAILKGKVSSAAPSYKETRKRQG